MHTIIRARKVRRLITILKLTDAKEWRYVRHEIEECLWQQYVSCVTFVTTFVRVRQNVNYSISMHAMLTYKNKRLTIKLRCQSNRLHMTSTKITMWHFQSNSAKFNGCSIHSHA